MTHELVAQREHLVQAERVAAWRELARRLAHERYPEQFDEVFREGSATLLAELANLKQIVGRFSDFARMPAPEMQPARLRPVQADPDQMTRVLRNLILNAIDAVPEGGTLTVRTVALEGGVRLEVSDTGQGLTPEESRRLFTPYYTTKAHGTGLGLAIVQSVVSDHHGRISVESAPGKGATFRIDLA
jgi:signal transduction histidine kinase